ncbi:DUF4082 domain-containing protein [Catenulispora yoronensis]
MRLLARLRSLSTVVICAATALAGFGLAAAPAHADPPAPPQVGDIGVFYADHGLGNSAVFGPDGNIWGETTYFDYSAGIGPNGIEVFSPTTRSVVARYEVSGIVTALVSGPDSSVWFTQTRIGPNGAQSELGEISMSGVITEHALPPSAGNQLLGIAPDAAGNVWFLAGANYTANSLGYVGFIAPGGAVTMYGLPAELGSTSVGNELIAGANGDMWFTGSFLVDNTVQVKVAMVTPAGAVTAYDIPGLATIGGPSGIVMGSDGDPWFTFSGGVHAGGPQDGHYVGTLTSEGMRYYAMPAGFNQYGLAEATDGNVYVAGYLNGSDKVAAVAVTPTGQEFEFSGTDTLLPMTTFAAPDGNIWMADGDTFGELTITKPYSTTLTLVPDVNPSAYGQDGNLVAHLAPVQPGAPPATGTVTFTLTTDGSVLGTEPVVDNAAALPLAALPFESIGIGVFDDRVVATYNGDADYGPETTTQQTQTVTINAAKLSLASTANPSATGQDVHITATLAGQGGGQPATGCCAIAFTVDGGNYNVPLTNGTAVLDLPSLSTGSHAVTATFHGFYGFGSDSASMTQTVRVVDPCPCTVFPDTSTPAAVDAGDGSAVELGVKVRVAAAGNISGVRFYKSAANTGSHIGSLWASNGTLLATGTFANETATGWQTLTFANPVPVKPGTTYIASYYAPNGHYSADGAYFATSGAGTGPITALADSDSGGGAGSGDGVYAYGPASAFPAFTWNATNYWVDAVFDTAGVPSSPPTVTATTPAASATGVASTSAVSAKFSGPIDPATLNFTLMDASGAAVPATAAYDAATTTATLTPSTQLPFNTGFTASVQAADPWGQAMSAAVTWSFTTGTTPPSYTCPCSLFAPTDTPAVANSGDGNSVELGTRFTSAVNGTITGVRFYKGSQNTGTHTGSLWTEDGNQLATGTFTDETADGWQTLTFANPVAITAGITYVASYHAPNGNYSYNLRYFAYPHTTYPLTAPFGNQPPGNGVYAYGSASAYPGQFSGGSNYWVDVIFQAS